ncbi:MAG: rhomboid family intramembrane serine protease [Planctomycetota bacterium]|jgi:membrane associated rhomboid family serine protease
MFIPLGTDRPLKRPTLMNYGLILSCAFVFMLETISRNGENGASARFFNAMVLQSNPRFFEWWQLLTYQFLHADFGHILGNMLFLYVFGPNVEDRLGRWWYLAFFLAGGACAGAVQILFDRHPVIGASGAIAAVTGAYLVFFPRTHIKTLIFFFFIGIFMIPSMWFIGFAIAKDLFWQGFGGDNSVAYLAHIGGYAFGAGISMALLGTGLMKHEHFDMFGMARQAHRRRQFKELASKGNAPWAHEGMRAQERELSDEERRARDLRAELARAIRSRDAGASVRVYAKVLEIEPDCVLPRHQQLDIANYLFQASAHESAAEAYSRFLDRYANDSEAPRVHLLLGLLYARYLDNKTAARGLLVHARENVMEASQKELAETLLNEIGAG